METISRLQAWYASQCNGDWEHEFGVSLETVDNPGWLFTVDLEETELQGAVFETVRKKQSEQDWVWCEVKDGRFEGRCGPMNLQEMLETFLEWVAQAPDHDDR